MVQRITSDSRCCIYVEVQGGGPQGAMIVNEDALILVRKMSGYTTIKYHLPYGVLV